MANVKVSEVLCFVSNRFCRMNRIQLKTVLITYVAGLRCQELRSYSCSQAGGYGTILRLAEIGGP